MKLATLRELSLNAVVLNLELFHRQWLAGIADTEKCLGIFSQELCEKYSKVQETKRNEYLKFLINPYLKFFDLGIFSEFEMTSVYERIDICGKNITHLTLSGAEGEVISRIVKETPNVHTLVMADSNCRDVYLKLIALRLPKLQVLDLRGCNRVTSVGLNYLCIRPDGTHGKNENLCYLDIYDTETSKCDVVFCLKHFTSLKVLRHFSFKDVLYDIVTAKPGEAAAQICDPARLPLNHFRLCARVCTGNYLDAMSSFPILYRHAEYLDVGAWQHPVLDPPLEFPHLKDLYLLGNEYRWGEDLGFLRVNGSRLVELNMEKVHISLKVVLECCPLLEKFIVMRSDFLQCDLTRLSNPEFPHLKYLEMDHGNLKESDLIYVVFTLWHSPKLESVKLRFFLESFSRKVHVWFLDREASVEDVLLLRASQIISLCLLQVKCTRAFLLAFIERAQNLESLLLVLMRYYLTESDYSVLRDAIKNKNRKFLRAEFEL